MFSIKGCCNLKKTETFIKEAIANPISDVFTKSRKNMYSTGKVELDNQTMPDKNLAKSMSRYAYCPSNGDCYERVLKYPTIIRNYLQVASQLAQNNQWPLAHGQNSGWAIPQNILKALGYTDMQCLRIREDSFEQTPTKEQELFDKVDAATKLYSNSPVTAKLGVVTKKLLANIRPSLRFDLQKGNRDYLLSATLGGLYCELFESPLSLVFGGTVRAIQVPIRIAEARGNLSIIGNEKTEEIGISMVQTAMRIKGYSEKKIDLLIGQLPLLYAEGFALPIGQLVVIGVPKDMTNSIYESTSYGIPTGKPISNRTEQVRLILSNEVMVSERITVINAMNPKEVESRCTSSNEKDVEECMHSIFNTAQPKSTENESIAMKSYATFIDKIDRVITDYL